MSNPLVSVVIPVYNLASYLPKCIESVLGQGIDALEIVAVDDGSTDNSRDVMQEYAEKDNRIKLIFKGNDGVSSGRNAGIAKASGEYLFFLDGDDWLDIDWLESAFKEMQKYQADIFAGGFICDYDDGTSGRKNFSMTGVL
ncbi:MAG: glycosyltransferase family 2 protein, partial [Clostridia bacterium]|nr:glycosyltransferase family 2 protein [Clostridia bacterium]